MSPGRFVLLVFTLHTPSLGSPEDGPLGLQRGIKSNPCSFLPVGDVSRESIQRVNSYCTDVLERFMRHPVSAHVPRLGNAQCSPTKLKYRCTVARQKSCLQGVRVDLASYVTDPTFWSWRFLGSNVFINANMYDFTRPVSTTESEFRQHTQNNIAVYSAIGFRETIEDRFTVKEDAEGTGASFFGVFDGHGGDLTAQYASDHLITNIVNKVAVVQQLLASKKRSPTLSFKTQTNAPTFSMPSSSNNKFLLGGSSAWRGEKRENKRRGLNEDLKYIKGDIIYYEKLLNAVILSTDKALMRASKAAKEDSGTTAIIAIFEGSQLIVANIGDSRGVMCDATGNAVPLSFDHKPNREDEKKRIEEEGGRVKFKNGKWMLDGWIEMSRTLGNRLDKFNGLIATPEVLTFDLSDYKPQFLVLATDGFYDVMRNDQIIAFIQARLDEEYYGAKSLVRYAYHQGSKDNITVMVVNLKERNWSGANMKMSKSSKSYSWSRRLDPCVRSLKRAFSNRSKARGTPKQTSIDG